MKLAIKEQDIRDIIENVLLEYKRGMQRQAEQQPMPLSAEEEDEKYNTVKLGYDPKVRSGKDWHEKGGNFPVIRDGKTLYVSRSVAMSLYCFCKNRKGEWCVLANKRGPGAPNGQGLWNVVCGYLDYGDRAKEGRFETAEEGAARECWEECGLKIDPSILQQQGVNSTSENVTIRFAAVLTGTTDNYPLSLANCEANEVTDVAWIPLQYVKRLKWAFGQGYKILPQAKTSLGYDEKTGQCSNDLAYKINALKSALRGKHPYEYQLFAQILQDLKDYNMV